MDTLLITECLPSRLRAGDALSLSIQTGQPSTSTFQVALTGIVDGLLKRYVVDPMPIDGNGVALLTLPSATTGQWLPGRFDWVAVAIDVAGNRASLAEGSVQIEPDPLGALPPDPRSYNRRMLDQIRALRQNKALDDVQMYKIGGRELTHYTHSELRTFEAEFEQRVRAERIRNGQRVPTRNKGINFGGR